MLSFKPSPEIEKALKDLQGVLIENYQKISVLDQAEKAYLNHCALISNIGASTRIENAILTDIEVEWVDTTLTRDGKTTAFEEKKSMIIDKLSKDRERSIEEVVGNRQVLATVYGQAKELSPLTEMTIRGLHHDLLRYYPAADHYAGQYKTVFNNVVSTNHATGQSQTVLEPTQPGIMTEIAMQELVTWYNACHLQYHWPILTAIEFVFRFLAIHPFQDGNGRLGRALFLLSLLQSEDKHLSGIMPYIAIDRHIEQNKLLYYSALHHCSDGKFRQDPGEYQYEPLVRFFLKVIERSISDISIYRTRYANLQVLSETAIAVLDSFKASPEKRLKVSDIETTVKQPRRTIQYSLKTLSDKGFIQKLGKGAGSRYQLIF